MNTRRFAVLLILSGVEALFSQPTTTFRYLYDDAGQLYRVLDSTGTLIEYTYDPSGNITKVSRSTVAPDTLSILNITPATAPTGTTITIQGQGFRTTLSANLVTVNGVALTVVSATSTTLVVLIPGPVPVNSTVVQQLDRASASGIDYRRRAVSHPCGPDELGGVESGFRGERQLPAASVVPGGMSAAPALPFRPCDGLRGLFGNAEGVLRRDADPDGLRGCQRGTEPRWRPSTT